MHPPANPQLLELLIACSLKTTILLACAWFATILARRQSAALRHLLWAAGIGRKALAARKRVCLR